MASLLLFFLVALSILCIVVDAASSSSSSSGRKAGDKKSLVDYVNILGGTDSRYDLSHGSTLPLIARPWSFNTYAPQTDDDGQWWFHPYDRRFYGIRVTHQPSPLINDYGNFLMMASIPQTNNYHSKGAISGYSPKKSIFSPHYFKASMLAYSTIDETMDMEFTPTSHGGIMRVKFPTAVHTAADAGFVQTRRISIMLNGGSDSSAVEVTADGLIRITGVSKSNHGGTYSNFGHYFAAEIYVGTTGNKVTGKPLDSFADSNWVYVDFTSEDSNFNLITVRLGTSLISADQALVNLKQEVGPDNTTFDSVKTDGEDDWMKIMSKVKVESVGNGYTQQQTDDLLTTFYSTMYRASLFPRDLSEIDSTGKEVHWSPYDGLVHDGPLSTDSGFWDAYSTVYPLHTLINRERLGVMINGWLSAYKEGGWVPKWASPGYRGSMVGTMQDVTIADAIVKNIPGFDRQQAYASIRKDAFEIPPEGVDGVGRVCLQSYLKYGYIPRGSPMTTGGSCTEIVSRSLNYLQSDWAIAQAARVLGFNDDYDILMQRSKNYTKLFEPETGFFRSRDIGTEKWTEPFDQFAWGGDYTEGGPWQFRYYVPYDPMGLAKTFESTGRNLCDELLRAQTILPTFHLGGYGTEIHEQTEMPEDCWGQYSHNNQPSHYMLYMFGASDAAGYTGQCAAIGQSYIRRVMRELYKPGADMYPGDDDNGQMSAWYILSSLGLYSLSPGSSEYVFGSPQFGSVVIDLDNGKSLEIDAINNSAENVYIQQVTFNGAVISGNGVNSINFDSLMAGGKLIFNMGSAPVAK